MSAWVNVPVLIPGTTAIENELPKPAQQRIRHLCSASRPESGLLVAVVMDVNFHCQLLAPNSPGFTTQNNALKSSAKNL